MDSSSIKTGARAVLEYFKEPKVHIDNDYAHISADEISLAYKVSAISSSGFSVEAKDFLQAMLHRKVFVAVKNLHEDNAEDISLKDLDHLANTSAVPEIESIFKPMPSIDIFKGSQDFGMNVSGSVHGFGVFKLGNEEKLVYVEKGDDGLSPADLWIGNIEDYNGLDCVGLKGKKINNADFAALDIKLENGEVKITILNRGTNINKFDEESKDRYKFSLNGSGKDNIYTIFVYDRPEFRQFYENIDVPRKFLMLQDNKQKTFNPDGRVMIIELNENKKPSKVILPFSIERLTFKDTDLGIFLDEKINHETLTDDGVMLGKNSILGADEEQLYLYKRLQLVDSRGIVCSSKGTYVFAEVDNTQKVFFIDNNKKISLIDKGNFFSNNFGVIDARVVSAVYSDGKFILLVQHSDTINEKKIRSYYLASLTEDELHSKKEWGLEAYKIASELLSPDATIRSISVTNEGIVYLLTDDESRKKAGGKEHSITRLSPEVSAYILGKK